MNAEIVTAIEGMGFVRSGASWAGRVGKYYWRVTDASGNETPIIVSTSLQVPADQNGLQGLLGSLKEEGKIAHFTLDETGVYLFLGPASDAGSVRDLLSRVNESLEAMHASNVCERCEETSFVGFYTDGTNAHLLCQKCYQAAEARVAEGKQKPNNYVLGYIASLVGALIGSVAWIALGALGFYASIAGYAIAFCAFKGYGLVDGKKTVIGISLTLLNVVFALFFAEYVGLYISLLKEYPGLEVMRFVLATPALFSDMEFLRAILPNLGLGLLFAVLGTYGIVKNYMLLAKAAAHEKIEKMPV